MMTCEGRRKEAKILLASENGKSLAVEFDGLFGANNGSFLGIMPLLWSDERGQFESLASEASVELTPLESEPS